MDNSISDLLTTNLAELGLPVPTNIIQTMLLCDGYFVGWKLRYDSGYSVVQAGGNTIDIFDEQGTLLKTVGLKDGRGAAA